MTNENIHSLKQQSKPSKKYSCNISAQRVNNWAHVTMSFAVWQNFGLHDGVRLEFLETESSENLLLFVINSEGKRVFEKDNRFSFPIGKNRYQEQKSSRGKIWFENNRFFVSLTKPLKKLLDSTSRQPDEDSVGKTTLSDVKSALKIINRYIQEQEQKEQVQEQPLT